MSDAPSGLIPDHLLPSPVRGGTHRHLLGLRPLDMKDWFVLDADTPALLANRVRLMSAAPDDVFMAEDGTDAAAHELRTMIAANLATFHGIVSTPGSGHPLVEAAKLHVESGVPMFASDFKGVGVP